MQDDRDRMPEYMYIKALGKYISLGQIAWLKINGEWKRPARKYGIGIARRRTIRGVTEKADELF